MSKLSDLRLEQNEMRSWNQNDIQTHFQERNFNEKYLLKKYRLNFNFVKELTESNCKFAISQSWMQKIQNSKVLMQMILAIKFLTSRRKGITKKDFLKITEFKLSSFKWCIKFLITNQIIDGLLYESKNILKLTNRVFKNGLVVKGEIFYVLKGQRILEKVFLRTFKDAIVLCVLKHKSQSIKKSWNAKRDEKAKLIQNNFFSFLDAGRFSILRILKNIAKDLCTTFKKLFVINRKRNNDEFITERFLITRI